MANMLILNTIDNKVGIVCEACGEASDPTQAITLNEIIAWEVLHYN